VSVSDTESVQPDPRAEAFYAHVGSGGKVEADDWMPDDYRAAILKFVEMHANSELMGVLPEREWILRAPTYSSCARRPSSGSWR
jgi:ring-1,2-phenylacetyl-CoA epoxidase subunit PaaA